MSNPRFGAGNATNISENQEQGSGHGGVDVEYPLTPDIHLKEVKRVLFSKGKAHSPVEDHAVFKEVMRLLSCYESRWAFGFQHSWKLADVGSRSAQKLKPTYLYTRLKNKIKAFKVMNKDFIFYFVLTLRFSQEYNADIYQSGDMRVELEGFIKFIAKSFKKLPPEGIADGLRTFLQRKTFNTKVTQPLPRIEPFDFDVFSQFLQSCKLFAEKVDDIHSKILIVSMYMATEQALGTLMREPSNVWKQYVIKAICERSFDEELIEQMRLGREHALSFKVPKEWTFNEKLMTDMFCRNYEEALYPFRLLKCFLRCSATCCEERFIFIRYVLHPIRVHYRYVLESHIDKDKRVKVLTTISGNHQTPEFTTVKEGIMVVDQVMAIQEEKQWSDAEDEFNAEIKNWLQFLLLVSDLREKVAIDCYKLFFSEEFKWCMTYVDYIQHELITAVERNFHCLHVDSFVPLFKELDIWQKKADYSADGFGLELRENGWKRLLKEIVIRFPDTHEFLLGFLKSAADWYSQKSRPRDFFSDLLGLEVPQLFCVAENDSRNVPMDSFLGFLQDYYERFHKYCLFTGIMESIMKNISDTGRNHFQDTVLQVIAKGTVREILDGEKKDLQDVTKKMNMSCNKCDDTSMQVFGWTIVGELSKSLPPFNTIQLLPVKYKHIYMSIGCIYKCHRQKVDPKCELKMVDESELPQCAPHASPQVEAYIGWVQRMHSFVIGWRDRLRKEDVTHRDIMLHKREYSDIHEVMKALGFEKLVFNKRELENILKKYVSMEEKLNDILIRTWIEKGITLWCNLPSVLHEYGLSLPDDIIQDIDCHVIYPKGREGIHYRTSNKKSECNYSLKIKPDTTLSELSKLCDRLQLYYKDLEGEHTLEVFVFFHLHRSSLFEKYMRYNIQCLLDTNTPGASNQCEVTVPILSKAIQKTEALIRRLIQGEAEYREIVADGAVVLKDVNTGLEIEVLQKSIDVLHLHVKERNGLIGVKAMVELFKAASHIKTLGKIFHLFNLKLCAEDEYFKELNEIMSRANDQLTPNYAITLLRRVKTILVISDEKSVDCLEFLDAVLNSKTFYDFLLVRRFYGKPGHKAFRQQYDLITAHLQNKASHFEEMILNHMLPAFKFLSPFIAKYDDKPERTQPGFQELVSAIWELDIESGPVMLRNVYQNVHLVFQWFSDVQGDTVKSIEMELEDVISTGLFRLKADAPFVLEFQRSAGLAMSDTNPSQHLCIWHTNDISEFVTHLGFLSSKGEKSRTFVCLNEVAQLGFDLISKIKHFEPSVSLEISCTMTLEEAKSLVQCLQEKLTEGRAIVTKVKMKYRWLYFIPGPIVSKLYKALSEQHHNKSVEIVLMSFPLTSNNKQCRGSCDVITASIQKELTCHEESRHVSEERFSPLATLMEVVGCFLDRVLPMKVPEENIETSKQHPVLHYTPGYNQEYLIRFLLEIYEGKVPKRFQVFWCDEMCNEDELAYFFDRIEGVTSVYTLFETNNLPLSLQEYALRRSLDFRKNRSNSIVHFVDTKPSLLQEAFNVQEHSVCGPDVSSSEASRILLQQKPTKSSSVELVCGLPGGGKSYYILNKLKTSCSSSVVVPINEGFSRRRVIESLCSLPVNAESASELYYGVSFNFTMYYTKEMNGAELLRKKIGWLLFELLILRKVDDFQSATSFQLHSRANWLFFIEVPPLSDSSTVTSNAEVLEKTIIEFRKQFPLFNYIGDPVMIGSVSQLTIDMEAQLVCKYLKSYTCRQVKSVSGFLGRLWSRPKDVKPHDREDIPPHECIELLKAHTPKGGSRMISQKLFVRYLYQRCQFLNILQDSTRYSAKAAEVCSNLFNLTLHEVKNFTAAQSWCQSFPYQLIYDVPQDGRANITVLTSNPFLIKPEQKEALTRVKVAIPTENMLRSRDYLVQCLCTTLKIPVDSCNEVMAEEKYVVTLDFVLKMLNINERKQCSIPVVIEGETGVGKTALVEILSKLWNLSHRKWIEDEQQAFHSYLKERLEEHRSVKPDEYKKAIDIIKDGCQPSHIALLSRLPLTTGQFYILIRKYILARKCESFWYLLKHENPTITFSELIHDLENSGTLEITVMVAQFFLCSGLINLFYKIAIHAALTPEQISDTLTPIFSGALEVKERCSAIKRDPPIFTIFLDELNTASCGGVLKEIIVDHALHGQAIPSNVFIVGACNPHRGDSTSLLESVPSLWCRTTYNVLPLHPTLRYLVWDYGALGHDQEEEYVKAKLRMVCPLDFEDTTGDTLCNALTELIIISQNMMRDNVKHYLTHKSIGEISSEDIEIASKSCVSQRDIQRIITFYHWILKLYRKFHPHGDFSEMGLEYKRRAVLVSLGIVYYLRQPDKYRKMYVEKMKMSNISKDINFSKAFDDDLDWMTEHITIPSGIAKTKALKENLFATVVCICTKTPVLIVGEPGSSKTLSFHLVVESLRGKESTVGIFKETDIFPSIDPYLYQCSRQTTSNDIVAVFKRAEGRQESFLNSPERHCVVFMDEAGLPEESRESLKALHYYLDNPSVAFVGISNHVLDAAKTNRCVSVVRMKMSKDELEFLAKGCICDTPNNIPLEQRVEVESIIKFCDGYKEVIKKQHHHFFGLRDFVHFLHYCRRYSDRYSFNKLVLRALERNFNGIQSPGEMFVQLMKKVPAVEHDANEICNKNSRGIVDILRESLSDSPSGENPENSVRYKLIIDPSKDNSLIRYLFKYGVVEKKNTRMFMCSDAFSDQEAQKVVIVSTICHSVTEGHTVILSQANEINESFYDLFNLRYRCIDDPEQGRLYYTNVAVGPYIKPCRVDRKFQCIVLLQEIDVQMMPAPFLNRFEKYRITYSNVLSSAMRELPYGWRSLMQAVNTKVKEFAEKIRAPASIFGYHEETVSSLFLWCLPAKPKLQVEAIPDHSGNSEQLLLEIVLHILNGVGFFIPHLTPEEMELDVKSLFGLINSNVEFCSYVKTLTHNAALRARDDAVHILNDIQRNDSPTVSVGACLIISLTLQWMVRHLCKTLMQVMTPEAVVVFDDKIPSTYLTHYLNHQEHFNLKKLINQYYQMMLNEGASRTAPSKLLVFCRTSILITNLTFNGASDVEDSDSRVTFISKESYHTEAWFSERLNEFYMTEEKCVLLIKVNMQETSVNAINHIRMMIEDTENQYPTLEKLAVVLLHFPLSMFSGGSYPSLFQSGWSHYYLDSVSITQEASGVNTEQWISLILNFSEIEEHTHEHGKISPPSLPECSQSLPAMCGSADIFKYIQHVTEQYIPTLVSLLASKMTIVVSTSETSDLASKKVILFTLLNKIGFGTLLCHKFQAYWNQSLFAAFLRKAASIILRRKSSARMGVIIQNLICEKFSEFAMYMVSVMNDSGSLHLMFDSDTPPEIVTLFKVIVDAIDLPDFSKLAHLNILRTKSNLSQQIRWQFPFYSMISHTIDDVITQCKYDAHEMSSSEEYFCLPTEFDLTLLVEAKLLQICQGEYITHNGRALAATLEQMEENTSLLEHYLCDLISDKLTVPCIQGEAVFTALKAYLFSARDSKCLSPRHCSVSCIVQNLISAHIYFHYPQTSLTRILPIVKQLNELKKMESTAHHIPQMDYTLDGLSLFNDTGRLCAYTIDTLFCYIQSVWLKDVQPHRWYPFYQKMINNQHVRKLLYKEMEVSIEAKLNVVHTAYVVLRCTSNDEVEFGHVHATFWCLINRYFCEQKLKDVKHWPQLRECASATFEIRCSDHFQFNIIHGLLEHFFSEHKPEYHKEDVKWLIQLSNGSIPHNRIQILTDRVEHGIPFGVLKHYLSRILSHDTEYHRTIIGLELQKTAADGPDTHYSPYYYAEEPPSSYRSLAHLYYSIKLEICLGNPYISPTCIMEEVNKLQDMMPKSDVKLLLSIEQQAFIQTLLKKTAEFQAMNKMLQKDKIESLLCDITPGDMMNHAIVIAMHLLGYCRNLSKLKQHIEHLNHNGLKCLNNTELPLPAHTSRKPNLFLLNAYKHLLPLYEAVRKEMERHSQCDMEALLNIHKSWPKSLHMSSKKSHIDSKNCLVMMLWLAAYHNFFINNLCFKELIAGLRERNFVHERQLKLFELLLVKDVQFARNNFFEEVFDTNCKDETIIEMRTCVVNVIAVIFGSPRGSNHLWYHLIEPEKLDGTFLTGFMYSQLKCSKEYAFYENGTHLTSKGTYGKYAYVADGGRGCLTLPSLYVLLWVNFATFGMAEWSTSRRIPFISEDTDTLKICSARLKSLWEHMTINLDFCDEHVSNLVTNCSSGVMEASCDCTFQTGIFREATDVEIYEKLWQDHIFQPAYASVSRSVSHELTTKPVLRDIDNMKRRFPQFPSFDDLSYVVQSVTLHQKDFKVLSQFVIEYQRLYLGSSLLPDLVKLYQWLHQELNHSVTMETASKLTLASIQEQLDRDKNASDSSREFFEIYRNVSKNFEKYVSVTGRHKGHPGDQHQSYIDMSTILLDLVSGAPDGKDCIYKVLSDIISSHRSLLECVTTTAMSSKELQRYSLLPHTDLHPSLVSPNDCIIDDDDIDTAAAKLSMLLSKWTCFMHDLPTKPDGHRSHLEFNLKELQEDVVEFYLAGKPMIQSAATLYTGFSFVQSEKGVIHQELVHIKVQLPPLFHEPLQKPEKKVLEKEFHSASFEDYQSLITIFSISVHILISEVKQAPQLLAEKYLDTFLSSDEGKEQTFWDTETERCRLSESQITYIKEIKLKNLYSVLEIFMKWNDAGVYDFHMLPYAVKGYITDEDEKMIIDAAETEYSGRKSECLVHLRKLESCLANVQPVVLDSSPQTPLSSLLDKAQTPLVECIPKTVCIHQYVSLRLLIRRLILSSQDTQSEMHDLMTTKWQEYEPEPWRTSLHCLMQTARSPHSDLRKEDFGFGIKTMAVIDHNLQERFECTSESESMPGPSLRKEYMSEWKTMEDKSTHFADMVRSINPEKQATNFNTDEVCKFLRLLGLQECVEWAENEGITGSDLMDSENNKDIEIENAFIRLKLVIKLECLQNNCKLTTMALQYPASRIAEFLGYSGERYEKYIQLFLDNGVDGEILHRANDQELKDLGIASAVDRTLIKHKFEKLTTDSSQEALSPQQVCKKLMDLKLENVATFVKEHGIDSEVFINASEDLKKDMGIKPPDFREMRRKLR